MFSLFSNTEKNDKKISSYWRFDSEGASVTLVNSFGVIIFYQSLVYELFRYDERPMETQLVDALHRTTRSLINLLITKNLYPQSAQVIIGEPWAHSFLKRLIHKRKTPFTVTRSMVKELLQKDITTTRLDQYGFNSKLHTPTVTPEIIGVFLSGHPVTDWQGKKTKEVGLDIMSGFFDTAIVAYVGKMIHEYLRVKMLHISYHTIQSITARYLTSIITSPSLVLYPSGLLTQLFWVDVQGVRAVGTFPIGLYQLEHAIKTTLNISRNEIQGLLTLVQQKIIDDRIEKKIQKSFMDVYQEWEYQLQKFCKQWVEEGLSAEQAIWIGDNKRNLFFKMVYTLWQDKESFALIFGSPKTIFVHSEQFLATDPIFDHYRESITDIDLIIIKNFQ